MSSVLRLGALALGDVAADTAVAHEAPNPIERRDAGNGDVARAAVRSRAGELEIPEWEVRVERRPVLAPSLFIGLDVRDLQRVLPISAPRAGASVSRSENSWRVKRCSASVSQYTSNENCTRERKRSSLTRSASRHAGSPN